ncbi:MAG: right-handed parallel beta-helix repeat-containing protein [Bacteroidales bacterium]|nr:right-handed parallel beta-helix repeat-containing protein [Bacteroidales bacterium]
MYRFIIFIICIALLTINLPGQTTVPPGPVSGVWPVAGSPYWVSGNIDILEGEQLQIEAGTEVVFEGPYWFSVFGSVIAAGTPTDSITFRPSDPVTGWGGIRIVKTGLTGQDSSLFNYVNIRHARNNGNLYLFYGGGIYMTQSSKVAVTHSLISENYASANGGGVYLYGSQPKFSHVTIKNNIAGDLGGGFFCNSCAPILEDVTITQNQAWRGGGVYLYQSASVLTFPMEPSNIYDNVADICLGKDIFLHDPDQQIRELYLDTFSVLVSTPYYASPGRNFLIHASHGCINQIFCNVYVSCMGDDQNSGLSPDDAFRNIRFAFSRICPDSANPLTVYVAPGIYKKTGGIGSFTAYPFSYCRLEGSGTGITILDAEGLAQGIHVDGQEDVLVRNLSIKNGLPGGAFSQLGGGIQVESSVITIENVEVTGCQDCGIYLLGSTGFVNYCKVHANNGCGIFNSSATLYATGSELFSNNEGFQGGALRVVGGNATLYRCVLSGNHAGFYGGAIAAESSMVTVDHTIINNNSSGISGGGIYCAWNESMNIINSTIFGNQSQSDPGDGVFCTMQSHVLVVNSIFWGQSDFQIYLLQTEPWEPPSWATVAYSNIQGGQAGIGLTGACTLQWLQGNISDEPLFVDPVAYDFHLQNTSACIDKGTDLFMWNNDTLFYLLPGSYNGSAPDQGAFEYMSCNSLQLKVFLEGPFSGGTLSSQLNNSDFLPLSQPYQAAPWFCYGFENVSSIPQADIVDWILVELLDAPQASMAGPGTTVATRACFLMSDGSVTGIDGQSVPELYFDVKDSLYCVIRHRNHLAVMSSRALTPSGNVYSYDFSSGMNQVYGGPLGHRELEPGIFGMAGGDGDASGTIGNPDKIDVWALQAGNSGYYPGDYDMNGEVNNMDKVDIWYANGGLGSQVP